MWSAARLVTPIGDHFELVLQGEAHRSSAGARPGGEWDAWFALPRRSRRILIGAGFARPNALPPDVLADQIVRRHPNLEGDPLEWFYRTCFLVLAERRRARHCARHLAVAVASGHPSYYRRREALALAADWPSFWAYRRSAWGPLDLEVAA